MKSLRLFPVKYNFEIFYLASEEHATLDFSVSNLTYLNRVGHFFRTNNKMVQALASKTHDHPVIVAL